MRDLKGKTAIVTGAASGIGLGIAKALAHAGANIVLADLRPGAAGGCAGGRSKRSALKPWP